MAINFGYKNVIHAPFPLQFRSIVSAPTSMEKGIPIGLIIIGSAVIKNKVSLIIIIIMDNIIDSQMQYSISG